MNRIKVIMKEQGRTQLWLAARIGKSQATVALYANNKLQPTLDILFKIAEHLDVSPKKLIGEHVKARKNTTIIDKTI